jgi:RNase P/RNase MRP subunit POP5
MKPTLNQKRRYIVFDVSERVEEKDMRDAINEAVLRFSGQYGSSKAGCSLVCFDGRWGVLRVGLKEVDAVKTSMLFIEQIGGKNIALGMPYVGGTIKSAKEFIIKKGGR